MGKPINEAKGEIDKCANHIQYYIDNSLEFVKDETIQSKYSETFITH